MQRFVVGQPASLTVELKDAAGALVTPTSLVTEVQDEAGQLLQVVIPVLASVAVIAIDTSVGQPPLHGGEGRVLITRYAYLDEQGAEQTATITTRFLLEAGIQVGRNSIVSEDAADLYATGLSGWADASADARRRALIEAYFRIGKLHPRPDVTYEPLDFTQPLPAGLPPHFLAAARYAQLLEADTILGGEPERDRQKLGMLSESTGESSVMFRPTGYLKFPVSPRTMQALRGYFSLSLGVGRG